MGVGTVLMGLALFVVVVAYVARPFRPAAGGVDPAKAIEFWVAKVREAEEMGVRPEKPAVLAEPASGTNYCPQCGRRVAADDRFCSGCGTRLRGGEE